MADVSNTLVDLASFEAEFAAEAVATALRARGVSAQVMGGTMAGFRAEAPGAARVVVFRRDLLRARLILEHLRLDMQEIDWKSVHWQRVSAADMPNPVDTEAHVQPHDDPPYDQQAHNDHAANGRPRSTGTNGARPPEQAPGNQQATRKSAVRRLRLARDQQTQRGAEDDGDQRGDDASSAAGRDRSALNPARLSGAVLRYARPALIAIIAGGALSLALVLLRAPARVALLAGLGVMFITALIGLFAALLRPRKHQR